MRCLTCAVCFETDNLQRRYCSRKCRKKAEKRRQPVSRSPLACSVCAGIISDPSARQLYCSHRCSNRAYRDRNRVSRPFRVCKPCAFCSREIRSHQPNATFCSRSCLEKHYYWSKERPVVRKCRGCGADFDQTGLKYVYFCSDACRFRHRAELKRPHRRAAKRRRKARKRALYVEPYRDGDIFERDGWRCMICGLKTARRKAVPHSKAPTIDHIVPLSEGGVDAPVNVQCAHFRCNSLKSAQRGFQRLLFG